MVTSWFRGPYVKATGGKTKAGGAWAIERGTPGLLEHLAEAAVGQVRIDTGGGRRSRREGLIKYTDPKPATDGLGGTEGQRRLEQDAESGKLARSAVLRMGRVNPKATRLLEDTHTFLVACVTTLSQHGVEPPHYFLAIPRNSLPASYDLAEWLTHHTAAIQGIDSAGWMYDQADRITRRIEKLIDRPEPLRTCGPCPTITGHNTTCATALEAKKDDREVTCPVCQQTYDVDRLIKELMEQSDDMLFTIRELVDIVLPKLEEPVPQKTLENWTKTNAVPIRGHNEAGAMMVRLRDVRDQRRSRPRHQRAG